MVNNLDWTASLSTLDFLRDIGKHFPVNRMLGRDVVRARLEAGISYTEFSYVLLQSMDYLELFRRHGCRLQTGGSDQWGNITAGVELIRRVEGEQVHALATPLVTKADGTKYGKTETGTVWLDPEMMSPYAFHQFWLHAEDSKVGSYLRIFSFRPLDEIDALLAEHEERPAARLAQRALASRRDRPGARRRRAAAAEQAAQALFGRGDLAGAARGDAGRRPRRGAARPGRVRRAAAERRRRPGGHRPGRQPEPGPAHRRGRRRVRQQRAGHGGGRPAAGGRRCCTDASWSCARGSGRSGVVEVVALTLTGPPRRLPRT